MTVKVCAHDHVHVLCIATFVFLDLVGHLLGIVLLFLESCLLFLFDLLHNKFAMSFNDYFQYNTSSTKSQSCCIHNYS